MTHEVRIAIRWRDVDAYGHVNNAVYLNYLEEARDRLVEDLFGGESAWDFVLAHVGIDFRRELTQADREVVAVCSVAAVGRSSVRTREQIRKLDGSIAAEAESVLVPRERGSNRSRPLNDHERAVLEAAVASTPAT
jgi:acyl-CoA thioester hydrolase